VKIKKGEPIIDLPEAVEPHTAQLVIYNNDLEKNPDAWGYMIQQLQHGQIFMYQGHGKDEIGMPNRFCIDPFDPVRHRLMLYPIPDKDYFAVFRYCPAMKQI
jgi:hypothetical protein